MYVGISSYLLRFQNQLQIIQLPIHLLRYPTLIPTLDTRSDARKNSRFIVYHYHLLFSQIYNDKSARWPSKHIENIVKKWIQELKISDHKLFEQDFISFKKIAPHTFEIVSRELLATPLAPIRDLNLGWAQLFRAPSWNTSSFTFTVPNHITNLVLLALAEECGTINTWRKIAETPKDTHSTFIFWFSSLSPSLFSYLFKTRKARKAYAIVIFPTNSTRKLTCSNCSLPFHKSKCPFPVLCRRYSSRTF